MLSAIWQLRGVFLLILAGIIVYRIGIESAIQGGMLLFMIAFVAAIVVAIARAVINVLTGKRLGDGFDT
jgi:hypothetical protein